MTDRQFLEKLAARIVRKLKRISKALPAPRLKVNY